ncbi:MAG: CDF family Co(II)/Ni(II) efflux transporter DmeF [Bacteroidota bacterium]|nr:CDF family Co(II)/Ni(II) efflux transporter DmeF [Bacteroidota bacterium]
MKIQHTYNDEHNHDFHESKRHIEKRTLIVVLLTVATMAVEITAGIMFHSMALLADGWHMGTHATALGISLMAYVLARRHSLDKRYAFGTWKIEILGAYTSALILGIVGVSLVVASIDRLMNPKAIDYTLAIIVAVAGLLVNIVSAFIMSAGSTHKHSSHSESSHPSHTHHDLNLRSAYLHVLADAATSVLAIAALIGGQMFGWIWLDPMAGLIGAAMIARWTVSLLRDSSAILLDREMDSPLVERIRTAIEIDGSSKVNDLHLWRVSDARYACIVSVCSTMPHSVERYRKTLSGFKEITHLTIETHWHEEGTEESSDKLA